MRDSCAQSLRAGATQRCCRSVGQHVGRFGRAVGSGPCGRVVSQPVGNEGGNEMPRDGWDRGRPGESELSVWHPDTCLRPRHRLDLIELPAPGGPASRRPTERRRWARSASSTAGPGPAIRPGTTTQGQSVSGRKLRASRSASAAASRLTSSPSSKQPTPDSLRGAGPIPPVALPEACRIQERRGRRPIPPTEDCRQLREAGPSAHDLTSGL